MNTALRIPSRWAGWSRSLAITATLSVALGACTSADNIMYGAREGTMEYPGSAAGPNAVPTYVVKSKDTVDGIASRYGVSRQSIVERNNLQAPYVLPPTMTIRNTAAPRITLELLVGALAAGAVILLPALAYLFRTFAAERRVR